MGEFWIVKFLETEFLDPLPLAILLAREETKPLMGAVFICMDQSRSQSPRSSVEES